MEQVVASLARPGQTRAEAHGERVLHVADCLFIEGVGDGNAVRARSAEKDVQTALQQT